MINTAAVIAKAKSEAIQNYFFLIFFGLLHCFAVRNDAARLNKRRNNKCIRKMADGHAARLPDKIKFNNE